MKVVWTKTAVDGWQEVAEYVLDDFGEGALQKFEQQTLEAEKTISLLPNIGSLEWSDMENDVVYRYVTVNRRSKMLYYVANDVIVIADFWDVRKNK